MRPSDGKRRFAGILVDAGASLTALSLLLPIAGYPSGNPGRDIYLMTALPALGIAFLVPLVPQLVLIRRPEWWAGRLGAGLAALLLLLLATLLGVMEFGLGALLCWDGVDVNGQAVGGCDASTPRSGIFLLTAGVLLAVAGSEVRLHTNRRGAPGFPQLGAASYTSRPDLQ